MKIVDQRVVRGTKSIVQHVAGGKPLTVKEKRTGAARAKNAERMRELRKDPEYRERENARRRELRKKKKEQKEALLRVPRVRCWAEKVDSIESKSGVATTTYRVRMKKQMVELTTMFHEVLTVEENDKENEPVCYIDRNESGNIRRAHLQLENLNKIQLFNYPVLLLHITNTVVFVNTLPPIVHRLGYFGADLR